MNREEKHRDALSKHYRAPAVDAEKRLASDHVKQDEFRAAGGSTFASEPGSHLVTIFRADQSHCTLPIGDLREYLAELDRGAPVAKEDDEDRDDARRGALTQSAAGDGGVPMSLAGTGLASLPQPDPETGTPRHPDDDKAAERHEGGRAVETSNAEVVAGAVQEDENQPDAGATENDEESVTKRVREHLDPLFESMRAQRESGVSHEPEPWRPEPLRPEDKQTPPPSASDDARTLANSQPGPEDDDEVSAAARRLRERQERDEKYAAEESRSPVSGEATPEQSETAGSESAGQ